MGAQKVSKIHNKRKKILKSASRLMSKKGYKGASIQEISDLTGIHKSTFFHYFKNKEELLLDILSVSIEEVMRNLEHILENKRLKPEEKLKKAILNHLELLLKYKDNVNIYHSEIRFLSGKSKQKYIMTRKYYAKYFESIVMEVKGGDSGYFKNLDAKIVTFGILGMCNWGVKWLKDSDSNNIKEIANTFYQMITQSRE